MANTIRAYARMSWPVVVAAALAVVVLIDSGCVYYNLFYNTRRAYEEAEKAPRDRQQMLARLGERPGRKDMESEPEQTRGYPEKPKAVHQALAYENYVQPNGDKQVRQVDSQPALQALQVYVHNLSQSGCLILFQYGSATNPGAGF